MPFALPQQFVFPFTITPETKKRCIDAFITDEVDHYALNKKLCAIDGFYHPKSITLSLHSTNLPASYFSSLTYKHQSSPKPTQAELDYFTFTDIPMIIDLILCKSAITVSDTLKSFTINICLHFDAHLRNTAKRKQPEYSLSNNLFILPTPHFIEETTKTEIAMITNAPRTQNFATISVGLAA